MPTLLLLDVSLSMSRPVSVSDGPDDTQRRNLAIHGINSFLDYLNAHSKLEFVSLVRYVSVFNVFASTSIQWIGQKFYYLNKKIIV